MRLDGLLGYYLTFAVVALVWLAVAIALWSYWPVLGGIFAFAGLFVFGEVGAKELKEDAWSYLQYPVCPPAPTGWAAWVVRSRLALFGVVTSLIGAFVLANLMNRDVTSLGMMVVAAAIVLAGFPGAFFSARMTDWLLGMFKLLTNPIFSLLDFAVALLRRGEARQAGFQAVYDLERRLFHAIAGYQTTFTFRADDLWEDFPELERSA